MAVNESGEKKGNISGGGGGNTDENKNGGIRGGIKKSTDERINRGPLFKKKKICCTIFFETFTISIVFVAFTKRCFTDKSH